MRFPSKIFVAGADTGVGKTLVSAALAASLDGAYWKPIQSGLEEMTDTQWVREKTGLPEDRFHPEAYRLSLPLSPHAAAARDGVRIDLGLIRPPQVGARHLIIEGAGGVMVPLNEREFMLDLMIKLGAPVLLVARSTLGTINHTLLSLEPLRSRGLDVIGVVLNGPENDVNRRAIEHYGRVKVLAEVGPLKEINVRSLRQIFKKD